MSGFAVLFQWLGTFWDWVQTGFTWILDGVVLVLQFIVFTILDGVLSVIEVLFAGVNLSSVIFNYASAWAGLPPLLIWLITESGLPVCFAMLGAAYLIRLTLNLVPSWATRV